MITCEHLTVRATAGDGRPVLRNLSMRIERGRVRAIVGGAGAGKSVLGAALRGALPRELAHARGNVRLAEFDPLAAAGEVSDHVAWLGENAEAELLRAATVRDALRATLAERFPGATPDDLTMCAALARLGLNDARLLGERPGDLAPGVRRRVALAQALVRPATTRPPCLVVLDEPLAGLDRAVADELVDALVGMRRAIQAAVVVLTRDLELAWRFAEEISVLEGGQLVETFYPERSSGRGRASNDGQLSEPSVGAGAANSANSASSGARAVAVGRVPAPGAHRGPALELRNFSVLLPDGTEAIPPVSVSLAAGGGLAITGPAGSGKSMFARALVGGLRPSSALRIGGEVVLAGEVQAPRAATRTPEQRRGIQLVIHDAKRTPAEVHTVRTQLRRAVRRARPQAASSAVGARVTEILRLVGLDPDVLLARVCDLSAEQRQRLDIGRALAHDPGVIVCDGLQPRARGGGLFELCAGLREATGVALVLLTRSSEAARASCDSELRLGAAGGPELVGRTDAADPRPQRRAA